MSDSGKPESELGFNALSDRLRKSLTCDGDSDSADKPDFRELDLGSGSPISTLRAGPAASTSSSSSGSVSSRTGNVLKVGSGSGSRKSDCGGTSKNHSGELSVDSSPKSSVGGSRGVKSGPARSQSGGPTFSGGSSATSPAVNVLPTGNICRSGRVPKPVIMSTRSSKPDVLSLGTANYGHGSIMRGGSSSTVKSAVAGGRGETQTPVSGISNSPISKRSSMDPEDLKRLGNEEYQKGHFLEALSFYDRAIALSPANAAYHCNRAAALIGLKRMTEAVKECEDAIKLDSGYLRAHQRLGSLLIR